MPSESAPIAVFASFSGTGGVERMVVSLIRGFVDLGETVDLVLVRADSPHLVRVPAEVRQVRLNTSHTLLAAPALARYLRERRPRALLAAKDRAGRTAVLARALAGTRTPILLRLGTHLSTAMAGRSGLARALRYLPIRILYPRIERIAAVSQGVAEDTARIARVPPDRIRVIRNPVIAPELTAQSEAPCPHPWLQPGQPPVILAVGRFQSQKDFPTLIRAFARVRQGQDCRLLILGEGGLRSSLAALICELGLVRDAELPGFQPNPYAFLARASLFVLSSAWEGSPNVLTEALALGIPAVSTDCPSGPAEILDGGRFGPLVPVGDTESLARAMESTLARPLPAETLKLAVREYEQTTSARRYLEALESAARVARGGSPI